MPGLLKANATGASLREFMLSDACEAWVLPVLGPPDCSFLPHLLILHSGYFKFSFLSPKLLFPVLSTDDLASYFEAKIEAIRQEFPQTLGTAPTN